MNVTIVGRCSIVAGNPRLILISRHDYQTPKIFNLVEGEFTFSCDLDLKEVDQIRINFTDKIGVENYQEKDTWVEITNIIVDDINLQHFIYKGKQYPMYDVGFRQQYHLPEYFQPGTKLFLNGVFEFDVMLPVWKFLMESHKDNA